MSVTPIIVCDSAHAIIIPYRKGEGEEKRQTCSFLDCGDQASGSEGSGWPGEEREEEAVEAGCGLMEAGGDGQWGQGRQEPGSSGLEALVVSVSLFRLFHSLSLSKLIYLSLVSHLCYLYSHLIFIGSLFSGF